MKAFNIASDTRRRPPEDSADFMSRFNKAEMLDRPNRMRGIRNMMAYTNLDTGPWSNEDVADLYQQGRDPKIYNFPRFLISGHNGNYVMNSVDPRFIDKKLGQQVQPILNGIENVWYSMKDRGRYKGDSISTYEDGLVYRGIQTIRIERPSADPRTWYIAFPQIRSDLVVLDPNVTSDAITPNLREAYICTYREIDEIIRHFPNAEDEIKSKMSNPSKVDGGDEATDKIPLDKFSSLDLRRINGKPQVIEWLHIKYEKVIHQLHKPSATMLPVYPQFQLESPEDVAAKKVWAMKRGIELRDEDIFTFIDWMPINYRTTRIPEFGILLQDEKDEFQLNGHVPIYVWAFLMKCGQCIGLMDFLYDAYQDINKREMAKTKELTQTPRQKTLISADAADTDDNIQDIAEEANDASKPLIGPSGVPLDNLMKIIPGAALSPALLQDESIKIDMLNKLAALPPAVQGLSERSGESSRHSQLKVAESSIMNRIPNEWIQQHEHIKARDWLKVFLDIFTDIPDLVFDRNDGSQPARLNTIVGYNDRGPDMENKLADLRDPDVIITMTKENDFIRSMNKALAIDALQSMPPSATNPGIRTAFEGMLAKNTEFADDEDKKFTDDIVALSRQVALKQAQLQLKTLDSQLSAPPPGVAPPGGAAPQGNQGSLSPQLQPQGAAA